MSNPTLPLSLIMPVSVVLESGGSPGPSFNQALIVGSSAGVITNAQRLQAYTSLAQMATAGFPTTSPEYLSATLYFGQTPAPTTLWVGLQDGTAIQTAAIDTAGTGYTVGELVYISGGTPSALIKITSIGGSGAVTGFSLVSQGSGYSIATGVATLPTLTGSGLTVNITAIGETPLQAITACRNASPSWYACMFVGPTTYCNTTALGTASSGSTALTVGTVVGTIAIGQYVYGTNIAVGTYVASGSGTSWVLSQATLGALSSTALDFYGAASDTDYEAIAGFIQTCNGLSTPASVYFLTSTEPPYISQQFPLFSTLQADGYSRTFPMYSTTQGGAFPNNIYASAAVMGLAMGLNTGVTGSYFTLAEKSLTGVGPEPLTISQFETIAGTPDRSSTGVNGNVYVVWNSGAYTFLVNGTMSSGVFFDQILFVDMLAAAIQTNGINLLTSLPSLPITDPGAAAMANVIAQACQQSQAIGFIAPAGVWRGPTIGPYSYGTPMPKGYAVYYPPVSTLSQGARAARRLPPMNVLIIEAEAAQSVVVQINVQP